MATNTVNAGVTAAMPFYPLNGEDGLFEVRAGLPIKDALGQASCLLDVADDVVCSIGMGTYEDDGRITAQYAWAVKRLIEMSKAIVDAVVSNS